MSYTELFYCCLEFLWSVKIQDCQGLTSFDVTCFVSLDFKGSEFVTISKKTEVNEL